MKFGVIWNLTKVKVKCKRVYEMRTENDETSNIVQCNLNPLKSNYLVLCRQRVYVLTLVKTGFLTDCAKIAVALGGDAWSRDRWSDAILTIAEFPLVCLSHL